MIHCKLALAQEDPQHNGQPWCDEIMRLSPAVLGHEIQAAPVKVRRIDKDTVARIPLEGHLPRAALAAWPPATPGGVIYKVNNY